MRSETVQENQRQRLLSETAGEREARKSAPKVISERGRPGWKV